MCPKGMCPQFEDDCSKRKKPDKQLTLDNPPCYPEILSLLNYDFEGIFKIILNYMKFLL